FKQALLATKSLVYQDPSRGATSGIHFAGVLQRLGIADAVKDKTVLWQGGYAAEALVSGKAELCVHQISEIIPVKGVVLVGPLPKELQKLTTYSGAVATKATSPEVARAFVAFLVRPAFRPKLAAAGLDCKEQPAWDWRAGPRSSRGPAATSAAPSRSPLPTRGQTWC